MDALPSGFDRIELLLGIIGLGSATGQEVELYAAP
jgi:hypothetical protein